METAVGQKRIRDEVLEALVEEYAPQGKKACENALVQLSQEEEEFCLLNDELVPKVMMMARDRDLAESKASMEETLRSFEKELGVSDVSEQPDFMMPVPSIDELSGSGLVASWSDVMWSTDDGLESVVLSRDVRCASESNPELSGCAAGEISSVLVEGGNCDSNVMSAANLRGNDKFESVDIGFLLEASDDELGIPPSPPSGSEHSPQQEQESLFSDSLVESNGTGSVHDAVSWALEGTEDNMGFADCGIDDWVLGSLDFFMDRPSTAYSTVSPLVEAGIVM